jgi:hypothetical protein
MVVIEGDEGERNEIDALADKPKGDAQVVSLDAFRKPS